MTFLSFHWIKLNYGFARMCKYFRKGRKVIWGEFDLWIPLQFVPCLFQEINVVFLLANFSSLHFDDGTPLMSKSRLQNYLWPFWRLQAVCSVLCFWVKQRTRLGSYIFMLKFNKFSRKTDRHSGINALQTFNKKMTTVLLFPPSALPSFPLISCTHSLIPKAKFTILATYFVV